MRVVVGRRELEHRAELRLGLLPAVDAEVRDAERLADRRLLGLAALRLLERDRRLRGVAVLEVGLPLLEEVVCLVFTHARYGKFCSNQVYRMRQVARSRDDDAANRSASRAAERVGELERRAGQIVEERHELGAEAPERNAGQARPRSAKNCADARIERRLAPRRAATAPGASPHSARNDSIVPRREDVVGAGDERGGSRARGERAPHGVGGTVAARLAGVADRGRRRPSRRRASSSTCSARWPVTTVTSLAAGGREVAQQRRDHRPPVDRQDRLRPALADRPHAGALARGHDDRVH